jgi:DNA-binding FadR family transcriptional regulator
VQLWRPSAVNEAVLELERCVHELAKGIRLQIKPPEDIGFHLALARATHNTAIMDATYLIFRFYQRDPSLSDESDLLAHQTVYEAVRDGDPQAARTAMLDHFIALEKHYLSRPDSIFNHERGCHFFLDSPLYRVIR